MVTVEGRIRLVGRYRRPRPVFTVKVEHDIVVVGGSTPGGDAGAAEAALAAEKLEGELKQISVNINELIPKVDPKKGSPVYALYAMVYLAAARAGVNPAHIKFVYRGDHVEEIYPYSTLFCLASAFNPYSNSMKKFVKSVKRVHRDARISSTSEAIDVLIKTISGLGDEPNEHTRLLLVHLLMSIIDEVVAFKAKIDNTFKHQKVEDILWKAAGEARDPDVKRLAQTLAGIIYRVRWMTDILERHLIIKHSYWSLKSLGSLVGFKKRKGEVLEDLEEARDSIRKIEGEAKQLMCEAEEALGRLASKGILLEGMRT